MKLEQQNSFNRWLKLYTKTSNFGLEAGQYEICCECGEILNLLNLEDHGKIKKCGGPLE